ncbi:hypothetical protein HPB51_024922 [Rhipicephalus microplus]|uniref:Uncharacterized protein n=1 Tax=Rhipicephalus microplus TaxID=6941 RepID=A0A9J6F9Y3_RHIMP|nr:hypothetical protein HPB51_024922 [Rhipicephalus microplus]
MVTITYALPVIQPTCNFKAVWSSFSKSSPGKLKQATCGEPVTFIMTEAEAVGTRFAGRLGQLEPFDESASDWASYEERLTSFLIVNRVPYSDKVHAFLSIIGPKTYGLFKSLTTPELPPTKSFEALKKVLSDHLSPKLSVIGERAEFYWRCQKEGESLYEFVAKLRNCRKRASLEVL